MNTNNNDVLFIKLDKSNKKSNKKQQKILKKEAKKAKKINKRDNKIRGKIQKLINICDKKEGYYKNAAKQMFLKKVELQNLLENCDNMDIKELKIAMKDIVKVSFRNILCILCLYFV